MNESIVINTLTRRCSKGFSSRSANFPRNGRHIFLLVLCGKILLDFRKAETSVVRNRVDAPEEGHQRDGRVKVEESVKVHRIDHVRVQHNVGRAHPHGSSEG